MVTLDQARAVKRIAGDLFARISDVAGVGITREGNDYAVKVNLREHPGSEVVLPKEINGVSIQVEIVGRIKKVRKPKP